MEISKSLGSILGEKYRIYDNVEKSIYLILKLLKTESYLLPICVGTAGRPKLFLSLFGIKQGFVNSIPEPTFNNKENVQVYMNYRWSEHGVE